VIGAAATRLLDDFRELNAVDTTCHLGQWPFRLRAAASAEDLRSYAQRHALSSVWVSHLAALFGFDTRSGNTEALRRCGDDLFRVFAVLDPTEATWERELAWMASEGVAGVRVAPGIHGYPAGAARDLAAACAELDLPLQVLVRLDDARVRHPHLPAEDPQPHEIADLIRSAPRTRILLSGLRIEEWEQTRRHLDDIALPHTFLDLWHVNGPLNIVDALGTEDGRWVFGSGYPVQTPEASMLQLTASSLAAAELDAIASGTAHRLIAR